MKTIFLFISCVPQIFFCCPRKNRRGFTLVEMVITIAVLSVGLVVILRSFLNMTFVLYSVKNQIDACYVLESKLNDLIAEDLKTPFDYKKEAGKKEETLLEFNNRDARYGIDFSLEAEDSFYPILQVSTRLSWLEGRKEKSFSLATSFLAKSSNP